MVSQKSSRIVVLLQDVPKELAHFLDLAMYAVDKLKASCQFLYGHPVLVKTKDSYYYIKFLSILVVTTDG